LALVSMNLIPYSIASCSPLSLVTCNTALHVGTELDNSDQHSITCGYSTAQLVTNSSFTNIKIDLHTKLSWILAMAFPPHYGAASWNYRSLGLHLTTHFNLALNVKEHWSYAFTGQPWCHWFTTANSNCYLGQSSTNSQSSVCPCHTVHSPHYVPVI
jgi:hypothetical protein